VSIQALHYLALCVLIPPLLSLFTNSEALEYEGGAATVSMVMDWREMAGLPTISLADVVTQREGSGDGRPSASAFGGAWSGGKMFGKVVGGATEIYPWEVIDARRGWVLACCWLGASFIECVFLSHY
jgi:protein SYS1